MSTWKEFEQECLEELISKYGGDGTKFEPQGGSDSSKSDIKVTTPSGKVFFIEVKKSAAQSGQFVLNKNENEFTFSTKNRSGSNTMTDSIQKYINDNFNVYKDVGTAPLNIDLPSSYFSDWIVDYYQNKGVKFIMTKYKSKFIIFPIEKITDYFKISASFRKKRSGTNPLPKKYLDPAKELFSEYTVQKKGKKTYIDSNNHEHEYIVELKDIEIILTLEEPGVFQVKKRGNLKEPNVIFALKCKNKQIPEDLKTFKSSL